MSNLKTDQLRIMGKSYFQNIFFGFNGQKISQNNFFMQFANNNYICKPNSGRVIFY